MANSQQTASLPQVALARSRAYSLLSHLFLHGLTAEVLPFVQAIPELSAVLPGGAPDFDELAADHYAVLQANVFPHASIFLDPAGLVGGPVADSVLAFYGQAGFDAPLASIAAPDHVGLELAFLAWLCHAQANSQLPGPLLDLQRQFLDEHVLRWLLPLKQAVAGQGNAFCAAFASLAFDLALEHRASLPDNLLAGEYHFSLPAAPDLLNDDATGIKDIAAYLLTPAYSGLFLSRGAIEALARKHNLPRGFGSRQQMLVNLFRSAATYDTVDVLFGDVAALLKEWRGAYTVYRDTPYPLDAISAVWLARLDRTYALVERLRDTRYQEQLAAKSGTPQT